MRKGLTAKRFIGLCIGLIVMSIVMAIGYGIKGEYEDMHNSLNWVLWMTITLSLVFNIDRRGIVMQAKDDYIESLEAHKTLTDEHIVSLKELIESHKNLHVINEKIIEGYKNQKPSRF